jgi:uncharacterized protein (DUF433 family)
MNVAEPHVEIGSLITRTPEIKGGCPRIAGTGVTVKRIAGWHRMGMEPERIAAQYGHLTLAQVHAALSYYYANRAEIEADLDDESAEYDRRFEQSRHKGVRGVDPIASGPVVCGLWSVVSSFVCFLLF